MARNKDLEVHILLDFFRGTRGGNESSAGFIKPLLELYPTRVSAFFYKTPLFPGILSNFIPERINEVFGTQHTKACIFDDEMVLSGANLSREYFENKQDRYLRILEPEVCNYFRDLCKTISSFSYRLNLEGDIRDKSCFAPPRETDPRAVILNFQNKWKSKKIERGNVYLVPMLQMAAYNIRHEENLLKKVLRSFRGSDCEVHLSTAYFNPPRDFTNLLSETSRNLYLISSNLKNNGFYNSKGISKHIPDVYKTLQKDAFSRLAQSSAAKLYNYSRESWVWHSKGIWLFQNSSKHLPKTLTVLGSSNFGKRSFERDLESDLLLMSFENQFQDSVSKELKKFYSFSQKVTLQDLKHSSFKKKLVGRLAALTFPNIF